MKLSNEQINKIMQHIWYEHTKTSNGYLDFTQVRNALKDFTFKIDEDNLESNISTEEKQLDELLKQRVEEHNKQFKVGDEALYVLPIISQDTKQQFEYLICKVEIVELSEELVRFLIKEVIREVTGNGIYRYYKRNKILMTGTLQYLYPKDDEKLGRE